MPGMGPLELFCCCCCCCARGGGVIGTFVPVPMAVQDHGGVWLDGGGCCIHREFTSGLLRELLLVSRELDTGCTALSCCCTVGAVVDQSGALEVHEVGKLELKSSMFSKNISVELFSLVFAVDSISWRPRKN